MKKIVLITLVAMLLFSITITAHAAPDSKVGANGMTWSANDAAVAFSPEPIKSARTNSSGDKISSNANSGSFPGLYFYWDDKQKDDGYLKVNPVVFKWFKDGEFILTAQNSNNYWDFKIKPETSQKKTADGCYVYKIPKQFKYNAGKNVSTEALKNINQVFIDGNWRTYELDIQKVWLDKGGNTTTKPGYANATFTNNYSLGKKTIRLMADDTHTVAFKENDIVRHKFMSVAVNGEVSNNNDISFTAETDGKYTVVFTNQCTDATVVVEKLWTDENIEHPTATFTSSYTLGENNVLAGTQVAFEENAIEDYTLKSITVNGNTVKAVDFPAEANAIYTIVFTNKPSDAIIKIEKVWLGVDGNEIDAPDGAVATFTNNYALGENIVEAHTDVAFAENPVNWQNVVVDKNGNITTTKTYSFKLLGITIGDEPADAVDFTAAPGRTYTIVFTNQMAVAITTEENPTEPPKYLGVIPSNAHCADWYKDYGIICFAANTTSDGQYYVAFRQDFFNKYESVKIGFGTANKISYTMTFTKDNPQYTLTNVTEKATGYGNPYNFGKMLKYSFDNPSGTGSMQAYLMECVKIEPTAGSAPAMEVLTTVSEEEDNSAIVDTTDEVTVEEDNSPSVGATDEVTVEEDNNANVGTTDEVTEEEVKIPAGDMN